jgi:hypothetical protein
MSKISYKGKIKPGKTPKEDKFILTFEITRDKWPVPKGEGLHITGIGFIFAPEWGNTVFNLTINRR